MDLANLRKGQFDLAEVIQGAPWGKDKGASQWEGGSAMGTKDSESGTRHNERIEPS
jgi:glutamate formiminotransferase